MKLYLCSLTIAILVSILPETVYTQTDSLTQIEHQSISKVTLSEIKLGINKDKSDSIQKIVLNSDKQRGSATILINGEEQELTFRDGIAVLDMNADRRGKLVYLKTEGAKSKLYHVSKKKSGNFRIRAIPVWFSIVPPLIAIILALLIKEVYISLFLGIWAGAFIAGGMRVESIYYFFMSLFDVVNKYVVTALIDSGHMSVIIFSLLIGGMVAIISKNGGMAGVVLSLSKYAKSAKSTQVITWFLGIAIFFDDYANTLIVGNTMRNVSDKFKISREKLAYIVDSTAAPVSAIAFITTWIGAELGYIDGGISQIDLELNMTAYAIFISSLKYSFYPILTLIFVFILIRSKKDFGPMLGAEQRARSTGQVSSAATAEEDEPNMEDLSPVAGAPLRAYYAIIPVSMVIFMTILGLVETGFEAIYGELAGMSVNVTESWASIWSNMEVLMEGNTGFFGKLGKLIGSADSYVALLWASSSGLIIALLMTIFGRVMKIVDTMHWMATGFKTMLPALIILALAWALAICTEELHTADFLSSALQDSLNPYFMPIIIFILSALIAFSTGSSWSTMAILYPIAIPTSYAICLASGLDQAASLEILLNVIATVLAASVLGDHCSPISDTTILSSLASDCNHIDHVRTQLPYALLVGLTSLVCLGISSFMGGGLLLNLGLFTLAIIFFYIFINRVGKDSEPHEA